jgi:Transposase
MEQLEKITHYAGLDWATDHHDIVVVDRQGLTNHQPIPCRAHQGFAIEQLLAHKFAVYPVNPKSAAIFAIFTPAHACRGNTVHPALQIVHLAGAFLDYWCSLVMRSRIEPMKRVARTLRAHEELLLNWLRAKGKISAGAVEGLNNKIRVVTRRSYGFRTFEAMEVALYHNLGRLPANEALNQTGPRIEAVP